MRPRRVTREFYGKLCIAALAILAGCATTRQATPAVTTVYLVRHGEKSAAVPNDADPDLSVAGEARARALADRLRTAGVTAIVTTQLKRTRETAQPLAGELGLTPEIVPTGETAHADSVAAAVMRHRGGKILVVGHSNTLAGIIVALGGPQLPNLCDGEYSNLLVMHVSAAPPPSLVRLHYGAMDPVADSICTAMQSR
jgi:phosphohistidine phosphatase SixA